MIKTDKLSNIQIFLEKHPGYLKWGKEKLAKLCKCEIGDIIEVKNRMSEGKEPEFIYLPNILILDVETSPSRAAVFNMWKQNIRHDQILSDWRILTWSAKWLGNPNIKDGKLTSEEVINEDDSRIIKTLWNLLNDADIVIAHNGDKFDIPKIKTRFLLNGLPPTTFYHQIDTLKIAQREFGFNHNNLDALATYLGIENKIHTGNELWMNCLKGDSESLEKMRIYNNKDVEILEKVYLKLRPYIKNHPNVTLYDDVADPNRCPTCGSHELVEEDYYYTTVGQFQVYRCTTCGALSRARKALKRGVVTANLSLGR